MADPIPTHEGHKLHEKEEGGSSWSLKEITLGTAELTIEICNDCHLLEIHCHHNNMEWNEEETELICQFCGIDGT